MVDWQFKKTELPNEFMDFSYNNIYHVLEVAVNNFRECSSNKNLKRLSRINCTQESFDNLLIKTLNEIPTFITLFIYIPSGSFRSSVKTEFAIDYTGLDITLLLLEVPSSIVGWKSLLRFSFCWQPPGIIVCSLNWTISLNF